MVTVQAGGVVVIITHAAVVAVIDLLPRRHCNTGTERHYIVRAFGRPRLPLKTDNDRYDHHHDYTSCYQKSSPLPCNAKPVGREFIGYNGCQNNFLHVSAGVTTAWDLYLCTHALTNTAAGHTRYDTQRARYNLLVCA